MDSIPRMDSDSTRAHKTQFRYIMYIGWMMWFIQFISFKNKIIKLITELLKYACKITNQTARHDSSD